MKKVVQGLLPLFCLGGVGDALAEDKPKIKLENNVAIL